MVEAEACRDARTLSADLTPVRTNRLCGTPMRLPPTEPLPRRAPVARDHLALLGLAAAMRGCKRGERIDVVLRKVNMV
ncbi:hypothetical protein GCM10010121_017960 [Streptomyces brasiliensis]|uniref:Uncharacterized protein n=1 Tax=Streptomyces brasiliensis TaxID=1954 RepID=A0A917KC89_9ACTN|nr:hypothetical protein GCM10010121_017960 [Streptomyces brasiliensis]